MKQPDVRLIRTNLNFEQFKGFELDVLYTCGLMDHTMQCRNCGLFFFIKQNSMQKEVYLQNNSPESLLQGGEIQKKKKKKEHSSHSSSVREVIPSHAPVISPFLLRYGGKLLHRPAERERERCSASTGIRNLVEFETERRSIQRTPSGQLWHPLHRIHSEI